jgi:SAM-dependent methyltransferase
MQRSFSKCFIMVVLLWRNARAFRGIIFRPLSSLGSEHSTQLPAAFHFRFSRRHSSSRPGRFVSQLRPFSSIGTKVEDTDPFEECWKATTWSMNPLNNTAVDQVLQALHSPAPQSMHIINRALILAQESTTTTEFVNSTLEACAYLIKPGYHFVTRKGITRPILTPGKDWNVTSVTEPLDSGWTIVSSMPPYSNPLQIANKVLSLVTAASQAQTPVDEAEIDHLVDLCEQRLFTTLGTDIRGRTSADAAFTLALAGVTRESLYLTLTKIARLEFKRVGNRPSRRSKDILQAIERLAAAGLRGAEVEDVYRIAADSLAAKTEKRHMDVVETLSTPSNFDLLSPRPLLWLWRFSARQPKARNETSTEEEVDQRISSISKSDSTNWLHKYSDTSRPLIIDIGCGLGVSLLGLASLESAGRGREASELLGEVAIEDCNYLGGDLSGLTIRFGQGIATRWNLQDRLQYTYASAEDLLDQIDAVYPGPVALVLIQFPTPYRLAEKEGGNTQLPTDLNSGFMANEGVMRQTAKLLKKSGGGHLLLQSNCEDVAVAMRNVATSVGMTCIDAVRPVTSLDDGERLPQRTQEWIRLGGERAIGPEWSSVSLLPARCTTETEVACELQNTPIHRCLMEIH